MTKDVDNAIKWFEKWVGTTEQPAGSNETRFGEHYGMNGVAWCAEFVWDGLAHHLDVDHIKSAYCPTVADWYRQKGRGFANDKRARKGDLVFFDFPDSEPRIQHIGIVVDNDPNSSMLSTIEGNTSSGTSGSQDNGGGVFKRSRPYSQAVYYGRPFYAGASGPEEPSDPKPNGKMRFERGDSGADVLNWQRELNAWGTFFVDAHETIDVGYWFPLEEDGEFGPATEAGTRFFQGRMKLEEHGRVGVKTITAMERAEHRSWLKQRRKKTS
jgi:hypothetical protein